MKHFIIWVKELEKLKQSYEILKKEMYEKQYEAIKFEQIIKDKDNQIRQLSEQLPEYTLEELENILKENKILREKISETEKSIDNLYMFKSNDSAILLEMDKLKSDIKRLIELLKSTDEVMLLLRVIILTRVISLKSLLRTQNY